MSKPVTISPAQIGEIYLISQNIVTLGTKPGLLDKMLGEKDEFRRVIAGKNIDPESSEYRKLCLQAFDDFNSKFTNDAERSTAINALQKEFIQTSSYSDNLNSVNWSAVFTNTLMLSAQATSKLNNPAAQAAQIDQNTFNDATQWLSEKTDGLPYGILAFATSSFFGAPLTTATQAGIAAAALSSISQTSALNVGSEDYATTVYCGPRINCYQLRDLAKDINVDLIEFDNKQRISGAITQTQRLIVNSHGFGDGKLAITENQNQPQLEKPDAFAKLYFPNAVVIHALGCKVGANTSKNFAKNSLSKNQLLFLHSGNEDLLTSNSKESILHLISEPNQLFPLPEPIQIIFKRDQSRTIFAEIALPQIDVTEIANYHSGNDAKYDQTADVLGKIFANAGVKVVKSSNDLSDKDRIVSKIYDKIATHLNTQIDQVAEKFRDIPPESKDTLNSELQRLGYRDYSQETDLGVKRELVQNYLTKLFLCSYHVNTAEIITDLEKMTQLNLINVNYVDKSGTSPAIIAASNKNVAVLEFLERHGADLNHANEIGAVAAHYAVENNDVVTLNFLASKGADFTKADKDGNSPIHAALMKGRTKSFGVLAQNTANLNSRNHDGATPASIAARNGLIKELKILATNGADFNTVDNHGSSPVIYAAETNQANVIGFMAQQKADLNKANNVGITATYVAAQNGNIAALEILIKNKADVNKAAQDGSTPAHAAADRGHLKALKILVENGADLTSTNRHGRTPLSQILYLHQTDTNSQRKKLCEDIIISANNLPIIMQGTITHDGVQLAQILLSSNKIDSTTTIVGQRHALSYAAELGREELTKLFLQHGFEPNALDKSGWSALNTAISFKQNGIVKTLLDDQRTNPNLDISSWTPTMLAASSGNKEAVEMLIKKGADLRLKNQDGKTAYDIAREQHADIAKVIKAEMDKKPKQTVSKSTGKTLATSKSKSSEL